MKRKQRYGSVVPPLPAPAAAGSEVEDDGWIVRDAGPPIEHMPPPDKVTKVGWVPGGEWIIGEAGPPVEHLAEDGTPLRRPQRRRYAVLLARLDELTEQVKRLTDEVTELRRRAG